MQSQLLREVIFVSCGDKLVLLIMLHCHISSPSKIANFETKVGLHCKARAPHVLFFNNIYIYISEIILCKQFLF